MKPSRLLYVINVDWYFSLHWQSRALAAKREGYEVHVATNFSDEKVKARLQSLGFKCHQISLLRKSYNPFKFFLSFYDIWKTIRVVKPNIVHSVTLKPNLVSVCLSAFSRKATVASVTGLGIIFSSNQAGFNVLRQAILFWFRLFSRHDRLIYLFENGEDRERFNRAHVSTPEQLQVIAGAGVDTSHYAYRASEPESVPFTILFAARLLKDKGLEVLIQAANCLRGKGIGVQLFVAGITDSDARNAISINQIEHWHQQGMITWLGRLEDVRPVMANSHVVALPTTYGEGVPRVLIEAASVGLPIIASDVAGCRDIVKHGINGILVQPNCAESLANALQQLSSSRDLRVRMGKEGRRLVEEVFAEPRVLKRTLEIYSALDKFRQA